ncbi:MAG: hypothetical protein JNK85_16530 [Verrucomicrobiales bacterium]|nr:hypothetical protein [Verrucomicrobiales bacterium]
MKRRPDRPLLVCFRVLGGGLCILGTASVWAASSAVTNEAGMVSPPKKDGDGVRFGLVRVDPRSRTVSFPAKVNMTNGVVEYAVVTEYGKAHESLLLTDAKPMDVQSGLLLLGAKPAGTNGVLNSAVSLPVTSLHRIGVTWTVAGRERTAPLEDWIQLNTGPEGTVARKFTRGSWLFNGSFISPEGFAAHFEGSIISLIRDPAAIYNNPRPDQDDDEIHSPAARAMPKVGTPVTVTVSVPRDGV